MPSTEIVMTEISLTFIKPLPLYHKVKPYAFHVLPKEALPEDRSNIETETIGGIDLTDLRGLDADELDYEKETFRFVRDLTSSEDLLTSDVPDIIGYCERMVKFVRKEFDADHVICYDIRVRI